MDDVKEPGLIAAWGFQELYVSVGDFFSICYLWLLFCYICPHGLVWNESQWESHLGRYAQTCWHLVHLFWSGEPRSKMSVESKLVQFFCFDLSFIFANVFQSQQNQSGKSESQLVNVTVDNGPKDGIIGPTVAVGVWNASCSHTTTISRSPLCLCPLPILANSLVPMLSTQL
jgi:hypothetical protein